MKLLDMILYYLISNCYCNLEALTLEFNFDPTSMKPIRQVQIKSYR